MALPAHVPVSTPPSGLQLRAAPGGIQVLPLPPVMRFDALRVSLREMFAGGQFAGAQVRLDLTTRELDMLEIRRIVHLLKDEFEIGVVGLLCPNEAIQRMAERELKLKIAVQGAPEVVPPPMMEPEPVESRATDIMAPPDDDDAEEAGTSRVLTIRTTVRSGAVVRTSGDVQVFGDVNPGAHIVAGGNILVFGALKGLAHAGTRDDDAFILAFDLRPTQLRIGKVIGLALDSDPDRPTRNYSPEIAYIHGGAIAVEPYKGRVPANSSRETQ